MTSTHAIQAVAQAGDELVGFVAQIDGVAHGQHVGENTLEGVRVQVDDAVRLWHIGECACQRVAAHRADIAHRLSDHYVRAQLRDERGIDCRGRGTRGAHRAIDRAGGLRAVDRRAGDAWQVVHHVGRIVALV